MGKKLKIATFNANSIRARLPLVIDWLEREKPDLLCLQETRVQDSDFPKDAFLDSGYKVVFRGEKGRAGVAIASLKDLEEVSFGFPDAYPSDEDRLIKGKYEGIFIVNTYIPQGQEVESPYFQYKLEWLEKLLDFFKKNFEPSEPLIWCGDFNVAPEEIDVYDPVSLSSSVDFHPEVRARLLKIKDWGFVDLFRKYHPGEPGQYTFWDYRVPKGFQRNLGWRIDHIWVTYPLAGKAIDCWIDREARGKEKPSDHTFLVGEFEL